MLQDKIENQSYSFLLEIDAKLIFVRRSEIITLCRRKLSMGIILIENLLTVYFKML